MEEGDEYDVQQRSLAGIEPAMLRRRSGTIHNQCCQIGRFSGRLSSFGMHCAGWTGPAQVCRVWPGVPWAGLVNTFTVYSKYINIFLNYANTCSHSAQWYDITFTHSAQRRYELPSSPPTRGLTYKHTQLQHFCTSIFSDCVFCFSPLHACVCVCVTLKGGILSRLVAVYQVW